MAGSHSTGRVMKGILNAPKPCWERGRSSLEMCYQCTLLGPLIAVEGKGRNTCWFMAQLDHRLERPYFDISKQLRRSAVESGDGSIQVACVDTSPLAQPAPP